MKKVLVNDGTKIIVNDMVYKVFSYVGWVFGLMAFIGVNRLINPVPGDIKNSYIIGSAMLVVSGIFLWLAQARKHTEITAESVTVAKRLWFMNKRTSTPITFFRTLRIYYYLHTPIGEDGATFYRIAFSKHLAGTPKRYTVQLQEIDVGVSFQNKDFDELVKLCRSIHTITGLEYFFDYNEGIKDSDELKELEEKLTGAMSPNTNE